MTEERIVEITQSEQNEKKLSSVASESMAALNSTVPSNQSQCLFYIRCSINVIRECYVNKKLLNKISVRVGHFNK